MLEDTKARCMLCNKLFKAQDFLLKHIALKHIQELEEVKAKVRRFFFTP